jgi:peroxiredoxin
VGLFAVSVDPPEASRRLRDHLKIRFTFLADREGRLLDALGIRHQGGRNDGLDIAYPTAMLVDAGGVVRWIYQSGTYRERARAEEIFAAIEALHARRTR